MKTQTRDFSKKEIERDYSASSSTENASVESDLDSFFDNLEPTKIDRVASDPNANVCISCEG